MTTLFKKGSNVFTVPAGTPFIPALLDGLEYLQNHQNIEIEDITVFFPNQRAIQTFKRHILDRSKGRATLLPTLKALRDLDDEDLTFASLVHLEEDLNLRPAIKDLRRRFLLQEELKNLPGIASLGPLSTQQRLLLAGELAKLLDQMQNQGTDFKDLENLEMEKELAEHWQGVLAFLGAITRKWPKVLEQKGLIDSVQRRTVLIEKLVETWKKSPPEGPVIAACSTGSVPIVRRLLKAISRLPRGAVIFPGFDRKMELEAWQALDETHPQFMMKQTLAEFNLPRAKVRIWPFPEKHDASPLKARLDFMREAMLPAVTTGRWHLRTADPKKLKSIIRGLDIIDCPTPREEAGVIALVMRHALEDKDKRAALVTPDRALARRVKAELRRWDIEVDDSAGTPLLLTPPGIFFSLCLNMVAEKFAPVSTLALLKHPLAHGEMTREKLRRLARALDQKPLRGTRPAAGIRGLMAAVAAEKNLPNKTGLKAFLKALRKTTGKLNALAHGKKVSFASLLNAHIQMAIDLSSDNQGEVTLWRGEKGRQFADFLSELQSQAGALGEVAGSEYPALIEALLQEKVVKPHLQTHPRLAILGTLEARLQSPDLVILGGLNEGCWPPEPAADPWMSREMRKQIGLPTPDQRVGQSAHDFYMAFGAPEVVLTRAGKIAGSPATASRWLQRMTALLGQPELARGSKTWLSLYFSLDLSETQIEIDPPRPRPSLGLRPRKLSVTNIELLMRDPYAVFAKHILKLKPLDDLEADPSAADKGIILHKIFELFMKKVQTPLPDDALDILLEEGQRIFDKKALSRPMVKVFWWPRFVQVAEEFIQQQRRREQTHKTLATEVTGAFKLKDTQKPFTVTAKADRIDRLAEEGQAVIIDYKTGQTATREEVQTGRKPQLALEGVMALEGGFKDIPAMTVSTLEYWKMGAAAKPLQISFPKIDIAATIEEARAGIGALVNYFDQKETPYLATPDPDFPSYGEYDLLARTAEWQNRLKDSSKGAKR